MSIMQTLAFMIGFRQSLELGQVLEIEMKFFDTIYIYIYKFITHKIRICQTQINECYFYLSTYKTMNNDLYLIIQLKEFDNLMLPCGINEG